MKGEKWLFLCQPSPPMSPNVKEVGTLERLFPCLRPWRIPAWPNPCLTPVWSIWAFTKSSCFSTLMIPTLLLVYNFQITYLYHWSSPGLSFWASNGQLVFPFIQTFTWANNPAPLSHTPIAHCGNLKNCDSTPVSHIDFSFRTYFCIFSFPSLLIPLKMLGIHEFLERSSYSSSSPDL